MKLLQEYLEPTAANLTEMKKVGGDMYLSGIFLQAAIKNGNGRVYPVNEITKAVEECRDRISKGNFILGELNHPDSLSVNLANVSHAITEIRMDGNNAIGKMKLLNTPSGLIVKALVEGGWRPGVSSRGTGNVNESGDVSEFQCTTVDIVYVPSAPDAYPNVVTEAKGSKKIMTLAEAVVHDKKAQAYFKKEINALIASIARGKK